jgi:hypothetical protein
MKVLVSIDRIRLPRIYHVSLQWEPRDIWIGVFMDGIQDGFACYICIVPCFPIYIRVIK